MKVKILFSILSLSAGLGHAQEVGHVISSTPVIQQVAVPRQVCSTDQVAVQQPKSGAGAALGAIAGGAVGNAIGRGPGRAAATMLGLVGGAIVGDQIEGAPPAQIESVQHCSVQNFYENRTVGYTVVYDFAGKRYTTQMPNDPGQTINLQVTPVGAAAPMTAPAGTQAYVPVTPVSPTVVVAPAPALYYPPVSVDLRYGVWDHDHGR